MYRSESKGATFSLKNREFPKIRHSKTQHSTVWYIFFWLLRSSASEINRYSANPDVAGESELGARSVSPTSGYTRPGKRRRRSDKDNIPPGVRKLPSPPTTLEQAQMEWDLVETVQPGTKCRPFTNSSTAKWRLWMQWFNKELHKYYKILFAASLDRWKRDPALWMHLIDFG